MDMLLNIKDIKVYDNSEKVYAIKGEYRLSSATALSLIHKANNSDFKNQVVEIKTLYSFLGLTDG